MGLGSRIFDKVVEKASEKAFEAAAYVAVETTAIVTEGAITAVKTVANGVKEKRAANKAAQQNTETLQDVSQYDLDLFYAKVAMCAYIANSDHNLSANERTELNRILSVSKEMYGQKATQNAKRIINNPGTTFMMIEPFISKVRVKDLDAFLIYAEEIAQADSSISPDEEVALERIRSYVESRRGKKVSKKKSESQSDNTKSKTNNKVQPIIELTCSKCGGHMHPDAFGYKADCDHCGFTIILNSDNAPSKELLQAVTQNPVANPDSENVRNIEFFTIRPNDNVQFYLNNTFIGDISDTHFISMNFPKATTAVTMTYGKNYHKRSEVIIPEDGNDYQIYGGRPDKVIYKLYVFPYGMFDDYMNAIYLELTNDKLKKWVNRHKGCQLQIFSNHFEFTYSSLFGDRELIKKVKYSKETLAIANQIPIKMKNWENNGYMYCIRKNVIKKFNTACGQALREDGLFVNQY